MLKEISILADFARARFFLTTEDLPKKTDQRKILWHVTLSCQNTTPPVAILVELMAGRQNDRSA